MGVVGFESCEARKGPIANQQLAADVEHAAFYTIEFRFETPPGHVIVIRADDKLRDSLGGYPNYSARFGLIFRVDAGRETDVRLAVNIISKEVETLLGRAPAVVGKTVVEWNGQSSLDSRTDDGDYHQGSGKSRNNPGAE